MREIRIDIVRGLAIIIILINHLSQAMQFYGLQGPVIPTPTRYGYSSAAELFVIMSGYMVGMVYINKPNPAQAILRRAKKLYIDNLILLIVILPLTYFMSNKEQEYWRINELFTHPWLFTIKFLSLMYAPRLLDVLQLYIVLMLFTPFALIAYNRSPWLLCGLSICLYIAVTILSFSGLMDEIGVIWNFNPLTWQLIFFVPMVLGGRRAHVALFEHFHKRWISICIVVALVSILTIMQKAMFHFDFKLHNALTSRVYLGPIRLTHAALMVSLYAALLVLARLIVHFVPFRILASIGRNSLNCFLLSVVTTYALAILWDRTNSGYSTYVALTALSVVITIVTAAYLDNRKQSQRRT